MANERCFMEFNKIFSNLKPNKSQKLFLVFLFLFYVSSLSARGLNCSYVYDIQSKYLDLHINFSNFDKKQKSFQVKLSQLESRLKDKFIKALDLDKINFTVSDVRDINKWMTGILSQVKDKNCSNLDRIYNLYYKRISERVTFAKKYLSSFVLDPSTNIVLDSKKRTRAKTRKQMNDFYGRYIQYQMANAIVASSSEEYTEKIKEARENVLRNYDGMKKRVESWSVNLSADQKRKCLMRKAVGGRISFCKPYKWYSVYLDSFARSLDPHSGYLSQEDHEDFEINMRLSLEGIGATLQTQYGHTIIDRLVPGGAAARSGKLKPKDKILAVGQSVKKMVNIFDMDLRDVVSLIRGKKGTPVYLKILRAEEKVEKNKIFTVRVIRDRINLRDQAASIFYFDRKSGKENKKIAVITIPSFYGEGRSGGRSVSDDIKTLLSEAKKNKIDGIVLDLSNNGGGSLSEAIQVAGLFFAKGNVVRQLVKTKNGDRYLTLSDMDSDIYYSGPLVVLVNRVSASASEIVSGALQAYKRAVVVGGDHTFGKGSIQSVEPLRAGFGSIRVTIGLFFIPNGFSTQLKGVSSDINFPSIYSNNEIGEKKLDYVLPEKKIPGFISKSAYVYKGMDKWEPISNGAIRWLKEQSSLRINKDKKFSEIKENIAKLELKRKKGYKISVAEIFDEAKKEKEENEKENSESEENLVVNEETMKKKYRERADVLESVNIAMDIVEKKYVSNFISENKD